MREKGLLITVPKDQLGLPLHEQKRKIEFIFHDCLDLQKQSVDDAGEVIVEYKQIDFSDPEWRMHDSKSAMIALSALTEFDGFTHLLEILLNQAHTLAMKEVEIPVAETTQ